MFQLNVQTYGKWKAEILQNLQTNEYEQNNFSPLYDLISDLKSSQILRKPLSNFTDDFLKTFLPSVILTILNSQVSAQPIHTNYSKLLKSICTLLPYFISSDYNEFIEAIISVVLNQKAPFYSRSFSHYHSFIKAMATPIFLQQIQTYFKEKEIQTTITNSFSSENLVSLKNQMASSVSMTELPTTQHIQLDSCKISFERTHTIFIFLVLFDKYLDSRGLKDFLQISFPPIKKMISSITDKDLRLVQEKKINRIAKNFLSVCSEASLSHSMTKLYINFNIRLINSGLLSKQLSGLKTIREQIMKDNKTTANFIYSRLKKENIIDNLLKNIHHELIKEFIIIIRQMIKDQALEPYQIKQLWITSIHQHQATIDIFFSALSNLSMTLTTSQASVLFEGIIETNKFPDAALNFIAKRNLKLTQKQIITLFNKFSDIYFESVNNSNNEQTNNSTNSIARSPNKSNNYNNRSTLLLTISKLIPPDNENRMIIKEKCLHFIEMQENIEYSIAILKEILIGISEDSAKTYFTSIINMSSINNIEFLDLIQRILKSIKDQLTDEEFTKLHNLVTNKYFDKYQSEVIKFWTQMINEKRLKTKMILTIFTNATSKKYSQSLFSFILFLFIKMNSSKTLNDNPDNALNISSEIVVKNFHKCKGLAEIWSLIYRENEASLVFTKSLVSLYVNSHEKDRYLNFIDHCRSNLRSPGVLKALLMLIHEVEDGINKELFNIYPNRFLIDDDYYTINITGECEMSIRTPKDISSNSLFTLISYLLSESKRSLKFSVNDQIFTKSDTIKNNMTICVRSTKVSPMLPPLVNSSNLPSMLIYGSSLCSEIFEIMNENNPNLSSYAYDLLTMLPNIKDEEKLAMSKNPDWDTFFQIEKPFLFLYRSNIIGNKVISRDSEWYDRFITTQGASKFINLVLNRSMKIPPQRLVRLMGICCLITTQNRFEIYKSTFFNDFPSDLINRLVSVLGKNNDTSLIANFLKFLSKLSQYQEEALENNKEFPIIVRGTFFHKETQIRVSLRDIILKLSIKIQREVATSLLPISSTSKRCAEFFTLIKEIAKVTDNIKEMWDQLLDIFFKKFACPSSENPISKLEFEAPTSPFVNGIITVLIELTKRFDTITHISDLFWFIIEKIIFNDYKYYEITPNYYKLLSILIEKEPKLASEFVTKLNSFKLPQCKTTIACKLLPYKAEKGLRNLGATCYMNSMLQQFFHITGFRDLILMTHIHNQRRNSDDKSTKENDFASMNETSESTSTCCKEGETNDSNSGITDCSASDTIDSSDTNKENNLAKNSPSTDRWLFELQKIFAKLIYFPSSYIDTQSFVRVWKDWDGQPVNPRLQQDAVEFLNMLLDRIEEKVPNSSDFFKGEIVHSVVGISQEYTNQTVETFVTFPLEVKDNSSVSDSLVNFLAPDRFDGQNQYNAEGIGKIDAEIYSRIRKAPQILIIQLKRFEYNLQTNAREKLNNRYTFYQELDLSHVMENPGDFVNYVLCGVTVHMGSAMGGHYISHVHTEYGWLTFDDENVTPIQEQEVLNASYGGYTIVENWDEKGKRYVTTKVPKNKNAYLLFYKRVMISQRDESSIFNFQNIQENMHPIDHHVLTSLLKDTKEVLNTNVLTSSNFIDFLMNSFSLTADQTVFLYNFFAFNLRNQRKKDLHILTVIANKIKELISPEFANFLCATAKEDDIVDFLLIEPSKELRKLYLSLFQKAVPIASNSMKDSLMKFVLDEILNKGDFLMKYWDNFDEFFRMLLLLIDRNTETWSPILFTFLLTSAIEYAESQPKRKMNILRNIDLSAIFEILNIVIKKRNLYDNFKAQATDSNFLLSFIVSKWHCSPFIEFILSFKVKPEQVFQKVNSKIEASAAASFFITSLSLDGNGNYVINFVKKKDETFIKNFFEALTERFLYSQFPRSQNLLAQMKPLLEYLFTSREKTLRISILEFLEAAQMDNNDTFNFLIGQFQNVITLTNLISFDNSNRNLTQQQLQSIIPTQEYFEILKKTVIVGGFQSRIIKMAKSFVDAIKEFSHMVFFPNLPIINLMDFLVEAVGSDNSEAFFNVASFSIFINSMNIMNSTNDYEFLRNFLDFIPLSQSDALFKHGVFTNLIHVMFTSPNKNIGILLMNHIMNRSNQNNFKIVMSTLFNYDIFCRVVNENGTLYFKTSWKLIKKCSSYQGYKYSLFGSAVFDGCLEVIEKFINEPKSSNYSEVAPYAAKLLAVFCNFLNAGNNGTKTKKSFFSSDPSEKVGKKMSNLKLSSLISLAKHEPKFCVFLAAISNLNSSISKKLFELIETQSDGFLNKVSTKTSKNASRMIASICTNFLNSSSYIGRIKAIVLRELAFASKSEVAEPLCEVVSKLLITKVIKTRDLVQIVYKVLNDTKDPLMFGGGFSGLIIEVIKCDKSYAAICSEKVVMILQESIITNKDQCNKEKIVILIDFLNQLKNSFEVNFPMIYLNDNEVELLELKKIKLKNNETAFDAVYRLKIIK